MSITKGEALEEALDRLGNKAYIDELPREYDNKVIGVLDIKQWPPKQVELYCGKTWFRVVQNMRKDLEAKAATK